jgi:hypothetical protein
MDSTTSQILVSSLTMPKPKLPRQWIFPEQAVLPF